MTRLTKKWNGGIQTVGPASAPWGPPAFVLQYNQQTDTAPVTASDTLLATISFPYVWVEQDAVGTAAPENWYAGAQVYFGAWWDQTGTGTAPDMETGFGDESWLGIVQLQPTVVQTTNTARRYSVIWQGPQAGIQLHSERANPFPGANRPSVGWSLLLGDFSEVFGNPGSLHYSVHQGAWVSQRILWGTP